MPVEQVPAARRAGFGANRWFILALLFVARGVIAVHFQSIAALGPVLVRDLAMDYAELGTIVGIFMLPGAVFSIPGGLLGQRFGEKKVTLCALGLMLVGGLWMGASDSYVSLLIGRVISGCGAVLVNILLAKMVTDWFAEQDIVLAMALFVSSWPVGIALALAVLPSLADAAGLSVALWATAAGSGIALLLVAWLYRSPEHYVAGPATFGFSLSAYEWLQSVLSGMVWTLYNIGFALVLAFGPSFLAETGMSPAAAGAVVSLVTWSILLSLPFGGYLAQRLNWPDGVMIACFLAVAVAIFWFARGLNPIVLCMVIGLLAGPPPGLIMALPSTVLRPQNRSTGMGIYYTCYYAGMAGLVPLAGVLGDVTGDRSAPLLFGCAMMIGAAACLLLFRFLYRRTPALP